MSKGKFIVFEGIDGCGKGVQINYLFQYLTFEDKYKQYDVLYTKEPTHRSYGLELIKKMSESTNPKEDAEFFYDSMIKDREIHCLDQINPALDLGVIVLCDRYKHSTYAYQQAQGVSFDKIDKGHKNSLFIRTPDITFIIDVPAEIATERLKKRGKTQKFEQIDFLEQVRENYLLLKEIFSKENIVIIDGERSIDDVFGQVKFEFEKLF